MRNYADEVNLHARIYAMRGRLLSLRDYASIVREQETFPDRLSDPKDLIEAKENIFREQIAPIISLAEVNEKYAKLFIAYLRQYEAHNLKVILAKTFGKQSLEQWYDIGPFATLKEELLQKKITLDEIKSLIANTYLADDFKDISSYRRMEIRVDVCAVRNLYNYSTLLSLQAKNEFQDMVLKRIAVMTVIWSYRLREYYHWSDERARFYIERLHDLFGGHAWPQVRIVEEALNQHIEQLRKGGGQEPSILDIERHLEQNYYSWVSSMFHRDFHSIYCVVAYLWLLSYQIRNLFRIIEGRRFGFSSNEILNKIICEA
jgi:vacuolar-type H+-ATPase subunit C/Vma6